MKSQKRAAPLTLAEPELDVLFPAHLRLDPKGGIVAAGPSLRAKAGAPLIGATFFETFRVERPANVADVAGLARPGRPLILRMKARPAIRLRGVALPRPEGLWLLTGHIPALGQSPAVPELSVADLSPADGALDILLAAEMQADLLAEARRRAESLEAEKRAAERANVAKSAFLATMSHEIRTPMNAVLGLAALLADTDLSAPQREMLGVMTASGRLLMDTLDDVLDISKIESGKMDLEEAVFDIAALAQGVGTVFGPAAAAKRLDFDVAVDAPRPWRRGDPVRIRQILVNLISNAIKFTEVGGVQVRLGFASRGGGPVLEMVVRDSGIGISEAAQVRLFTPFTQADGSMTRRFGGSGLGLAITRLLCDQMGGSITAESRIGRGSAFTVAVPLPEAAPPAPAPEHAADDEDEPPRPHVLVVEDNDTNQFVLSLFLRKIGATFDMTRNGSEALLAWERGVYDVVLMDVELPVLDGLETTRELRRRERALGGRPTPIVGLSADATIEARVRAKQAGMDEFMTKPIDIERLRGLVRRAAVQGCPDDGASGAPETGDSILRRK